MLPFTLVLLAALAPGETAARTAGMPLTHVRMADLPAEIDIGPKAPDAGSDVWTMDGLPRPTSPEGFRYASGSTVAIDPPREPATSLWNAASLIRGTSPAAVMNPIGRRRPGLVDRVVLPYLPLAGQLADTIATTIALRRGLVEANPLLKPLARTVPLLAVVKVGIGLASVFAIRKLQAAGRWRQARFVSAIATLSGSGPAAYNLVHMPD